MADDVIDLDAKRQERLENAGMEAYERGEAFMIEPRCAEHLMVGDADGHDGELIIVFTPFESDPLHLVGMSLEEAQKFGSAILMAVGAALARRGLNGDGTPRVDEAKEEG